MAALFWIRGTDGEHIQSSKTIFHSSSRSGNSRFSLHPSISCHVREGQTAEPVGAVQMQRHQPQTACLCLWELRGGIRRAHLCCMVVANLDKVAVTEGIVAYITVIWTWILFFSAYQTAGTESTSQKAELDSDRAVNMQANKAPVLIKYKVQLSAPSNRAFSWSLIIQIAKQVEVLREHILKMTHVHSLLTVTSLPFVVLISVNNIHDVFSPLWRKDPYLSCWQSQTSTEQIYGRAVTQLKSFFMYCSFQK